MATIQESLGLNADDVNSMAARMSAITASTSEATPILDGTDTVQGEVAMQTQAAPATEELDMDEALARIMQSRATRRHIDDTELQAAVAKRQKVHETMSGLYAARDAVQADIDKIRRQLTYARDHRLNDVITSLEGELHAAEQDISFCKASIAKAEKEYADIAGELNQERSVREVAGDIIALFIQNEEGQYVAKGTPQPSHDTARAWLEKRIAQAVTDHVLREPYAGENALLLSDKGRWAPASTAEEVLGAYEALLGYQRAIQRADREKDQQWVAKLVKSGYLIPPDEVARQKKDKAYCHTVFDLLDRQQGRCYVRVFTRKSTDIPPYTNAYTEVCVEYAPDHRGHSKHAVRLIGVTVPQLVKDFFEESGTQTFAFDDLTELSERRGVPYNVQSLFQGAIKFATRVRREAEERKQVLGLENPLTLAELAQGQAGTMVVSTREICMQLVSDGTTVRPGNVTTNSKDSWLYEAVCEGVPVKTFLARSASRGEFTDARLQELEVGNEHWEVQCVAARAEKKGALRLSPENASALVMLADQGGRDGAYVLRAKHFAQNNTAHQNGNKQAAQQPDREVGYVVRHQGDKVAFEPLTPFSARKLQEGHVEAGKFYDLVGLNSHAKYLLRSAYCAVTHTPREQVPAHLAHQAAGNGKTAGSNNGQLDSPENS